MASILPLHHLPLLARGDLILPSEDWKTRTGCNTAKDMGVFENPCHSVFAEVFPFCHQIVHCVDILGFPGGASGKEPGCQCRRHKRHRFHLWIRKIPWRRAWQPTPVLWPGESPGERSLAAYRPWGRKESDTTEVTSHMHRYTTQYGALLMDI